MEVNSSNIYSTIFNTIAKKSSCGMHFFVSPQPNIVLHNCKVLECNNKYFVLLFEKKDSIFLFSLLKKLSLKVYSKILNKEIYEKFENSLNNNEITEGIYPIYHETHSKDKFAVRCYYYPRQIKMYDDDSQIAFFKPSFGTVVKKCEVSCKNVWMKDGVYGFNIVANNLYIE